MKKLFKYVVSTVLVACTLAVVASAAATFDFNIVTVDETAGQYKVVATVSEEGGFLGGAKCDVAFDNSIFVPISAKTGKDANIAGGTVKTPIKVTTYFDEDNEEDAEIEHSPASPAWTVDGDKATLTIETYTTLKTLATNDIMVFEMYFRYADGKSAADIKADSFVIDYIKLIELTNGEQTYKGTDPAIDVLAVKNNVVPAEETPELPVPYIFDQSSIRSDSKATGIRYKAFFSNQLRAAVKEYGYLITAETAYNALPVDYTLDMALVETGKAKKGAAYIAGTDTDIFFDMDGSDYIVTMVANKIPLNKDAVTANIVARPYYILENGAVVYGATATKTVYGVAVNIKNNDKDLYEANKDYIDQIIALVPAENVGEIVIDTSELFK